MTTLLGQLLLPTRNAIRDRWLRNYALRNPGADITEGSLPYIDASVYADAVMPIYANARYITESEAISSKSTADLTSFAQTNGVPNPGGMPATGSVGYVVANTSLGGARVIGTDNTSGSPALELRTTSGVRYNATVTGVYTTGQLVPIAAVDTGAQTNQPVGTALTVTGTPYGLAQTLLVAATTGGAGLIGGAPAETDADRALRIEAFLAAPPGAGNDAAYQTAIQSIPNLPVQAPFTWPAIEGPGTTGLAFTLNPVQGLSRCPSPAQLAIAAGQIGGQFPGDDGQFVLALQSVPVALALGARWSKNAAPWVDAVPWPQPFAGLFPFVSANGGFVNFGCRIAYPYGGPTAPAPLVGGTIGLFNPADGTFRQKRILSYAGVGTGFLGANESVAWNITFDMTASDPSYVPISQQLVSPWSDSLAALAPPVIAYFQNTGPGEVFTTPFDAGSRRLRQPEPPLWPSALDTPILAPLLELAQTASVTVLSPALPFACPVGTAPVFANLLELGDLAAYPI